MDLTKNLVYQNTIQIKKTPKSACSHLWELAGWVDILINF